MERITKLERRVLFEYIRHGNIERIASEMGRSDRTVHASLSTLRRKLSATNDLELVAKAIRYGIVPIESKNRQCLFEVNEKLENVLRLPTRVNEKFIKANVRDLLRDTIYYRKFIQIDEFTIEKALTYFPDIIQCWQIWQTIPQEEDCWYVEMARNGEFQVGIRTSNGKTAIYLYNTEAKAYAVFIKRELERIRCL